MDCLPQITEDIQNIERNLTTLIDKDSTIAQEQARDVALESVIVLKGNVLALGRTFE